MKESVRYEKSKVENRLQNNNQDSTYECVEPPEEPYQLKKIETPPLPPPLPSWNQTSNSHHRLSRNNYRNSDDSLDDVAKMDEINGNIFSHFLFSSVNLNFMPLDQESDSGLEVVEEPTLRPSELVRGNNNRSLSMISGE